MVLCWPAALIDDVQHGKLFIAGRASQGQSEMCLAYILERF